jgi:hypothetical protein
MEVIHEIKGSCHCGNIKYRYFSPIPASELPIRKCDCSFCTKQASHYSSHPDGRLIIELAERAKTVTYCFGTQTAQAHLCSVCGAYPFMTCEIDANLYAVINVNTFDDDRIPKTNIPVLSLSNEPVENRLQRRKKYWISNVEIKERAEGSHF